MKFLRNKSGFSLVEIALAIAVFSIFSVGIFYLSIDTINRDSKVVLNTEGLFYAQEGLEVARNIRDKNYLLLTNGDHGLALVENAWSFAAAPESIDAFYERTITVSDVYRDLAGNISAEGTVYDPDTKKVESEVSWLQNGIIPHSVILTSYLSNWRGDDLIRTTCTEFTDGTFDNTEIVNIPSPPEDNCGIRLLEIEEESSFFSPVNVGKHGEDVDVEGSYAYLATDETNRGLNIINVSDPLNPVITSYKDLGAKGNYIQKNGDYAYVGIDKTQGLSIVNVSNPASPSISANVNTSGAGNQPAIFGNYLFMALDVDNNSYKVYNVTSKTSPTLFKTINFNHDTHVTTIQGNYAYVGVDDDHSSLKVFDISNINNITQIKSFDVGEEINAIAITGSIAFVGIEEDDDSLSVVDISNPANPSIITTLNVGGEIQDLTISGDYLYAAVDSSHSGLAAINISNPYSPTLAYNLDVSGKGTGIDSDTNYVYISTDTSNKGLVIVGTTVQGVSTTGTYISDTYDTGSSDTIYNFIEWFTQGSVAVGAIKFQIRTADSAIGIDSATWVGPDGTNSTYYETPRTIITLDPGSSGSRYVQFQAFLQSDGVTTPILDEVRINYTP
jgi:prepilin-type N-terminal cleavage/methylation domain-containing protein